MSLDTPFVEYLISGTHTSIWLLLIVMDIFGVPVQSLSDVNAGLVLLFIPLAYIIGTLFSTLTGNILDPYRIKMRNSIFPYERYKDEIIAYSSSELYAAYTARVHRVRLVGASIFNWLFLGVALLFQPGVTQPSYYITVIFISISLSILSAIAWRSLIRRMLEFRKNAIDVIHEESSKNKYRRKPKKNS